MGQIYDIIPCKLIILVIIKYNWSCNDCPQMRTVEFDELNFSYWNGWIFFRWFF